MLARTRGLLTALYSTPKKATLETGTCPHFITKLKWSTAALQARPLCRVSAVVGTPEELLGSLIEVGELMRKQGRVARFVNLRETSLRAT